MSQFAPFLAGLVWISGFVALRRAGSPLLLVGGAVVLAAWLVWRDSETRRLFAPNWRAMALGAVAGLSMVGATYLLFPGFVRLWPALRLQVTELETLLFAGRGPAVAAAIVVPTSIAEEILFRGRWLDGPRPRSRVFPIQAAAFYAAVHVTSWSPALILAAFTCGALWGVLRRATGSLWSSVVCHLLWDTAVMVIWPL